jgi:cyanophycinase
MGGKLVIAGGNIEFSHEKIHRILIEHAMSAGGKLAIVPTASGKEPFESISYVENLWLQLGVRKEDIVTLPVFGEEGSDWMEPAQGDKPEITDMLEGVSGFWFTGGDQYYTHKAFIRKDGTDSKALQIMKNIYDGGGVIGGTSAGAAIMSKLMIASGNNANALTKEVKHGYDDYDDMEDEEDSCLRIVQGLGFFTDGVIDQHYDKRPRLLRTIKAVMHGEEFFGYGVSEDTAMIYDKETKDITVAGSGAVYILDLRKSKQNSESSYECSNAVLHVIKEEDKFNQWT